MFANFSANLLMQGGNKVFIIVLRTGQVFYDALYKHERITLIHRKPIRTASQTYLITFEVS